MRPPPPPVLDARLPLSPHHPVLAAERTSERAQTSWAPSASSELPERTPWAPSASSEVGEWASGAPSASSAAGGSFECNICLELAQDPVVTLCGHLFCWPCLYRWLRVHSTCQDCPVCKAIVEEEKLVPLYGRGNVGADDPRKKAVPGVDIPHRPAGQRPETARPRPENQVSHQGLNFTPGSRPMATASFGNFTFSAGLGLFPSLLGFQMHGFPDGFGFSSGHPFGAPMGWHTGHLHAEESLTPDQQHDAAISKLLLFVGFLVVLCFIFF